MEVDFSVLWQPPILMLAASVFAVLESLGRIVIRGRRLALRRTWRMVLPVLPLLLGCGGAFLPGTLPDCTGWGSQVIAGIWAGLLAVQGRKIVLRWFVDQAREGK